MYIPAFLGGTFQEHTRTASHIQDPGTFAVAFKFLQQLIVSKGGERRKDLADRVISIMGLELRPSGFDQGIGDRTIGAMAQMMFMERSIHLRLARVTERTGALGRSFHAR